MKRINILVAAALLTLTGCIKDNSTSMTVPLKDIQLLADDSRVVNLGEEAEIIPAIEWGEGVDQSESAYDYEWRLNAGEVISTSKVLKYTFTTSGSKMLNFTMTDKATGLTYNQDYSVAVSSPFFLGWLILSEASDGTSHLSFIHNTTHAVYPDIYASLHGSDPLGSGPLALADDAKSATDYITVIQKGGTKALVLDGSDFSKFNDLSLMFQNGKFPAGESQPVDVIYQPGSQGSVEIILFDSGNAYDRSAAGYSGSANYETLFFDKYVPANYTGTPKWTNRSWAYGHFILYDAASRRLFAYYPGPTNQHPYNSYKLASAPEGFNYTTGLASDVNLVYLEKVSQNLYNGHVSCVFERGGKYYFNDALWTGGQRSIMTISAMVNYEFGAEEGAGAGSVFHVMRGAASGANAVYAYGQPVMFYSVGQKLYFLENAVKKSFLYKDFSTLADAPKGNIVSIAQNSPGSQLAVAFEGGDVIILNVGKNTSSSTNSLIVTDIRQGNIDVASEDFNKLAILAHAKGLPGKPVDVIFKYGKYANWNGYTMNY
jgi:hypothetical protein